MRKAKRRRAAKGSKRVRASCYPSTSLVRSTCWALALSFPSSAWERGERRGLFMVSLQPTANYQLLQLVLLLHLFPDLHQPLACLGVPLGSGITAANHLVLEVGGAGVARAAVE